MKVKLAVGQWDGSSDSPTVIGAVDEYTEDSWGGPPDWYLELVATHRKDNGEVRELIIEFPDTAIDALFAVSEVPATVVGPVQ